MARNYKVDAEAVLARVQREGPDARVTRGQAVAILDLLLKGSASYQRRKRIGVQLDTARQPASRRSRVPRIEHTSAGFTVDDLAHWAVGLYRQALDGLPRRPRIRTMTGSFSDVAVASDRVTLLVYPGTVERCHAEMRQMYAEIRSLTLELAAKDRELAGKEQEFKDRQTARLKKK